MKMWTSLTSDIPMVRIFIRPKFLLVLSLVTLAVFLLLNWLKEPEMLKADVHLKQDKHLILFRQGQTVQELRYLILEDFYHQLRDKVPPACINILKQDDTSQDGEFLSTNRRLFDNIKIKAKLAETKEEMAVCTYQISTATPTPQGAIAFHKIHPGVFYQFWSPVNGDSRLLRRDVNTGKVDCKGRFNDNKFSTVLKSTYKGRHKYTFTFQENVGKNSKHYALTVESKESITAKEITSPSDVTAAMKFMPSYFWSFTLLQNINFKTLYLGCNDNGEAVTVSMNDTRYPDARALFITNKFVPIFSP